MIDFSEKRKPPSLKENGCKVSSATCDQPAFKIHLQCSQVWDKTMFRTIKTYYKNWMNWKDTWKSNYRKCNNSTNSHLRLTFNRSPLCVVTKCLPCRCRRHQSTSSNITLFSLNPIFSTTCKALTWQVQTNQLMTSSESTIKDRMKLGPRIRMQRRKQWQIWQLRNTMHFEYFKQYPNTLSCTNLN